MYHSVYHPGDFSNGIPACCTPHAPQRAFICLWAFLLLPAVVFVVLCIPSGGRFSWYRLPVYCTRHAPHSAHLFVWTFLSLTVVVVVLWGVIRCIILGTWYQGMFEVGRVVVNLPFI